MLFNAEFLNDKVEVERDFTPGPFGQIHVRIARPRKAQPVKRPLFLFPPTPHSGDYYRPFMAEMASDRIVVAVDTPGYGDSARADALLSVADFSQSAVAAIDGLGFGSDKIDLLGYHTGCLIACEAALARPGLVNRLVLPGLPYFTGAAREAAYKKYAVPDTIDDDGSHLIRKWEYSKVPMQAGVSPQRTQEHYNDLMQSYPHTWRAFHAVFTYPSEERLAKVRHPALLLSVSGSLEEETKAARALLQNAEYAHLDGFTFGVFDLAPEVIAAKTREFLDE